MTRLTTPFGRRPLSLAHVAANAIAAAPVDAAPVHKWQVFRDICAARRLLGLSERQIAVLDALLTFHPDTTLSGAGLIVFPSNRALSLRAHGMPEATLRRHLAALTTAGVIVRRDSPNGKRYARKSAAGDVETAFGFDLAPLAGRAGEFAELAETVRAEERALRIVRERLTLCRRDITKMLALAEGQGADVHQHKDLYRTILAGLPRQPSRSQLEGVAADLSLLAEEVQNLLESLVNQLDSSGSDAHSEQHIQIQNTDYSPESEPRSRKGGAEPVSQTIERGGKVYTFPLGMIMESCPDLADFSRQNIASWPHFLATVAVVRPMLGISPSAWAEAVKAMGEANAAIVVACILQRTEQITSAGGYLRDLTRRAGEGTFSPANMVMALLSVRRNRDKMRA